MKIQYGIIRYITVKLVNIIDKFKTKANTKYVNNSSNSTLNYSVQVENSYPINPPLHTAIVL